MPPDEASPTKARAVLAHQALGRVVRRVRKERRIPDEKRLLLRNGMVDEFSDRLHALTPDLQSIITMAPTSLRIAMGHPMSEPAILKRSFPPLARLVRKVTVRGQCPDKTRVPMELLAQRHIQGRAIDAAIHVVARDAVLKRMEPGDDGGQGRTAKRRRHVATFENQTLPGETVEIRSPNLRMPHEAVVRPRLIIAEYQDDIGRLRLGGARGEPESQTNDGK